MSSDRHELDTLTLMAAATVAWALAIGSHQVAHGVAAAVSGARIDMVTALGITGRWTDLRTAGTLLTSVSGTVANILLMGCAWRAAHPREAPGLTAVLGWLVFTSSGWIASGHLILSPLLGAGDWMSVADLFANRGPFRVSVFVTGLFVSGLLWKATHERLAYVVGGGSSTQRVRVARRLTRIAGVVAAVLSATVGMVTGGWGPPDAPMQHAGVRFPVSLPGAVGIGGLTSLVLHALVALPLLRAPVMISQRPVRGPLVSLPRSPGLIGMALVMLGLLVLILGPGLKVG